MSLIKPNLILLHPPAVYDFRKLPILYGPIADGIPSTPIYEMYPIGFLSIVDYLEKNGFNVRIINLAARMLSSPKFNVEKMLLSLKTDAFGIDLHWLPHAQGSIEIAKICKKYHPKIPVILGGYSATYFFRELIRYPFIDYIIRGDSAEEPLFQLMKVITEDGQSPTDFQLRTIPNLVWKNNHNGEIYTNQITNIPDDINKIAYNYNQIFKSTLKYQDFKSIIPIHGWAPTKLLGKTVVAVITCRGCYYSCAFCGGSRKALATYTNRNRPAFRSPELVAHDIAKITRYTGGPIFVIGDILQAGKNYAERFLAELKKFSIKNRLIFELFNTTTEDFFENLSFSVRNFNFEISPETHDEHIRKILGKKYNNTELENTINAALEHNCNRFELFFMIGLPQQTKESVMETVNYCGHLMNRFGSKVVPYIFPYAPFLDPGSIIYENADNFGYRILFKTFEDYRRAMEAPCWKYALSYETKWLSKDDIVDVTYQAGLKLNELKLKYGLIGYDDYQITVDKIKMAIELTARIDKIIKIENELLRTKMLMELKTNFDKLFHSLLNRKIHVEW